MTAEVARHATPIALPSRVGQGTAIEQSRAVAEVQAAIVVAQQCPRNIQAAIKQMEDSCAQPFLAERAFFRYSRGGSQVTGGSIHLARELARCWGNVQYGLTELRRDDAAGQSEMLAFAWDVQTNTRPSTTFFVPHVRDTRSGQTKLVDVRDIYENNANHGARRVREQIFAVLPPWFVEKAKQLCRATIENGGGEPLDIRIAKVIDGFAVLGVGVDRLAEKIGRSATDWTAHDVASLVVIGRSLKAGEATIAEEFPSVTDAVSIEDVKAQAGRRRPARNATPPAADALPVEEPPTEYAPADVQGEDPWVKGGEQS